jgi:hypothetical protein
MHQISTCNDQLKYQNNTNSDQNQVRMKFCNFWNFNESIFENGQYLEREVNMIPTLEPLLASYCFFS